MKHNWEYKTWNDVIRIYNGKNQRAVENPNGEYPIYGSGGMMSYADDYICPENCTIIGRKGNINKPIFVSTKFWNVDTAFGLFPAKSIHPRFLYYFCVNYDFEKHNKATTIPSLIKKDLLKINFPVPPREVQDQIVAELDKINEVIENCRELLHTLDSLAQSLFYKTFGDPIENPKGWPVAKMKELTTLITNGTTPKGGQSVYVDSGITFFRSQNVWRNKLVMEDIAYLDEDTNASMKGSMLHHNDILITKTGRINTENSSLGRSALFTGKDNTANINGHVYLVRLNDTMAPRFVLSILLSNSYRNLIRKVCVGAIDKRQLNLSHIEDFPIIKPPLDVQNTFVKQIKTIEAEKKKVEATMAEVQTLLDSRMDYWFN